jgi:hypothetical protein
MKKQIKKLGLSKRTISNLKLSEMSNKIGGATHERFCTDGGSKCDTNCNTLDNKNTCYAHKTCYTC